MPPKPPVQTEKQIRSIHKLVRLILESQGPDILEKHIRALLDTLLWKLTEVDGKRKTRYRSDGALKCSDESQLRHEHVFPRSKMIDELLAGGPEELDKVLQRAVGCTVSKEEHLILSRFDKTHAGWDRYRKASVTVYDTQTGERKV